MGIIVQYRGTLRKPEQVEAFEDRIVELAVEMDGMAQIWRSSAEENKPLDPDRALVLLELLALNFHTHFEL